MQTHICKHRGALPRKSQTNTLPAHTFLLPLASLNVLLTVNIWRIALVRL